MKTKTKKLLKNNTAPLIILLISLILVIIVAVFSVFSSKKISLFGRAAGGCYIRVVPNPTAYWRDFVEYGGMYITTNLPDGTVIYPRWKWKASRGGQESPAYGDYRGTLTVENGVVYLKASEAFGYTQGGWFYIGYPNCTTSSTSQHWLGQGGDWYKYNKIVELKESNDNGSQVKLLLLGFIQHLSASHWVKVEFNDGSAVNFNLSNWQQYLDQNYSSPYYNHFVLPVNLPAGATDMRVTTNADPDNIYVVRSAVADWRYLNGYLVRTVPTATPTPAAPNPTAAPTSSRKPMPTARVMPTATPAKLGCYEPCTVSSQCRAELTCGYQASVGRRVCLNPNCGTSKTCICSWQKTPRPTPNINP